MRKILLLLCCLTASCGSSSAEKDREKKKDDGLTGSPPRLIGKIASIPSGKEFALVQLFGGAPLPAGASLTTLGPGGRSANLYATGEKLNHYIAADIRSGTVEIGDPVYLRFSEAAPVQPATNGTNFLGLPLKPNEPSEPADVKSF